jgi:hypothetical protein
MQKKLCNLASGKRKKKKSKVIESASAGMHKMLIEIILLGNKLT